MQADFLNNLKKDWQNQKEEKIYNKEEIFNMTKRKSRNSIKWLLIISLIEFFAGLGTSILYLIPSTSQHKTYKNALGEQFIYWEVFNFGNLAICLFFIYLFWRAYQKISNLSSVKHLMNSIFSFRRIAHLYIFYGFVVLVLFSFWFFSGGSNSVFLNLIEEDNMSAKERQFLLDYGKYIFIGLMFTFFAVYYLLVYGILLGRLKKNYKSLVKVNS